MSCHEVEERLSDYLEGALGTPAHAGVAAHLAECAECRALLEAMGEVVTALRSIPVLEPSQGLARRAADAALAAGRRRLTSARLTPPGWLLAMAAGVVLALTAGVVLLSRDGTSGRRAFHVAERTDHATAYLAERTDRLVEDVRILRVVIGTAFEGRVDRVQDRVDDYRRLLERRRTAESVRKSQGFLQNKLPVRLVDAVGRQDAGRETPPSMALRGVI